jgi:hypothetical protein
MDYDADSIHRHPVASWEKVTRKMVDDITFLCSVDIDFVPSIEDCWYETTCLANSHPRIDNDGLANQPQGRTQNGGSGGLTSPGHNQGEPFFAAFGTGTAGDSTTSKGNSFNNKSSTNRSALGNRSGSNNNRATTSSGSSRNSRKDFPQSPLGTKPSLGAFFSKSAAKTDVDLMSDNHSISSKSMNSRSVADRSNAERSKSEKKLADKKKKERDSDQADDNASSSGQSTSKSSRGGRHKRRDSKESIAMHSIDELSTADFSKDGGGGGARVNPQKDTGPLGNFLAKGVIDEDNEQDDPLEVEDARSAGSRTSKGSRSGRSKSGEKEIATGNLPKQPTVLLEFSEQYLFADRGICERQEDDETSLTMAEIGPGEKHLRFQGGHQAFEIPKLTNSMFDDMFYASDELADFRYEAFLEEAGLDLNDYM